MTDLDLATTDQLVEELLRRSDNALIVLRNNKTKTLDTYSCRWAGGSALALGLAHYAMNRISRYIDQQFEDDDDDPEETDSL